MTLWVVRAGKKGMFAERNLERSIVSIGWDAVGDLSRTTPGDRPTLELMVAKAYPSARRATIKSWSAQIWRFLKEMREGDLVVMPVTRERVFAIGQVDGPYEYAPDLPETPHTRRVKWLANAPFDEVPADLRHSFGGILTVFSVTRHSAEHRVVAFLERGSWERTGDEDALEPELAPDLEELSFERIRSYIEQKFSGHALADLVARILEAKGYTVEVSPPGPDGGVDILAGTGPLGFDGPRLAVQVKSSPSKVDVRPIRELHGVMGQVGADHGLFVAWGGYTREARRENRKNRFFSIRLWDGEDVVRELLENYSRLGDDVRNEIPLKRIWILDDEE